MTTCPNCGTRNEPGSRFCAECGADLREIAGVTEPGAPAQAIPRQYDIGGSVIGSDTSWGSGGAVPPPPEKPRRTWLWIVIGVLGACILLCCLFFLWAGTIGEDTFSDWSTRIADEVNEASRTPTPARR